MLPKDFNDEWDTDTNGPLIHFNSESLKPLPIAQEDKEFLSEGGLPETPAPYLEFVSSNGILVNLTTKFGMTENYKNHWFIGTTGSGNPICLKASNRNIVYIDHQNKGMEVLINSSINQFAECLISFSRMISESIEINGEDAYVENNIPENLLRSTKEKIYLIDELALKDYSFWNDEFDSLIE